MPREAPEMGLFSVLGRKMVEMRVGVWGNWSTEYSRN